MLHIRIFYYSEMIVSTLLNFFLANTIFSYLTFLCFVSPGKAFALNSLPDVTAKLINVFVAQLGIPIIEKGYAAITLSIKTKAITKIISKNSDTVAYLPNFFINFCLTLNSCIKESHILRAVFSKLLISQELISNYIFFCSSYYIILIIFEKVSLIFHHLY